MRTVFFTGKGDDGKTRLGKTVIPKDDPLFELLGQLDELNSWLGLCKVEVKQAFSLETPRLDIAAALLKLQETLFIAQAEVASAGFGTPSKDTSQEKHTHVTDPKVVELEELIKNVDEEVPPITKFIIPGGSRLAAQLDVARTLARRAERDAVALQRSVNLSPALVQFLNRLSSALFALARYANHALGASEDHPTYQ
jgi:cob(I)alamin adenosyltransferase